MKEGELNLTTQEAVSVAAYDARGRVLQFAIELEYIMGIYVAEHFTKDQAKIEEFFSLVLSTVNFDAKYKIFIFLVKKYNADFAKNNEGFSKEIKDLIEIRNVFAHWPVDFSKESLLDYDTKKVVTYVLIQKRNNKLIDKEQKSEDDINSIITRFVNLNEKLRTLI